MTSSRLFMLPSLLLLLSAAIAHGQAPEEAEEELRWYRVELLIFSQGESAGEEKETWESNPQLHYPPNYRFLLDSDRIEANKAEFEGLSTLDSYGLQTITIADPTPEIPATIDPNQPDAEPEVESATESKLEAELELELIEQPPRPSAFTPLPRSELAFLNAAAQMRRSAGQQTLYHKTWLQPMADELSARSIVVDQSGDDQQWPQLQGSIKFYLSRYLHLETNLWLNTDANYFPVGWQMPAPPLGPTSLAIIYPEPEPQPQPQPESESDPQSLPEVIPEIESSAEILLSETLKPELTPDSESETVDVPDAEMPPIYPWRHAILLQQKRRMRSTEVHYIDHPMFGVVVQLTPVAEEELLQRAAEEEQKKEAEQTEL